MDILAYLISQLLKMVQLA